MALTKSEYDRERRVWVRHNCEMTGSCQPAVGEDIRWAASIQDISQGGVKLTVDRRFESGTILDVEVSFKGEEPVHLMVLVVHVSQNSGGRWALGCRFAKALSDQDLKTILKQ